MYMHTHKYLDIGHKKVLLFSIIRSLTNIW